MSAKGGVILLAHFSSRHSRDRDYRKGVFFDFKL